MNEAQRSLVICDPNFEEDELRDLLMQSPYLSDSQVVRTASELSAALSQSNPSVVVQVYRDEADSLSPVSVFECVKAQIPATPCIVTGPGLTEPLAAQLKMMGITNCCSQQLGELDLGEIIARVGGSEVRPRAGESKSDLAVNANQLFAALGEGVLLVDLELRIQEINPALETLTGQASNELQGAAALALDAGGLVRHLADCQQHQRGWRGTVKIRRQDGTVFPAWAVISPVQIGEAENTGFAVIVSDISERQVREENYKRQASFDVLTGLPNRALLQDRMLQVLAAAKRKKLGAAVLYVDLDHFKEANDTWGHGVGDELLIESAKRMQACIRESDTVARIGGDEFVVILTDIGEDHLAEKVASKISGAIERPFVIAGAGIYLSASIGIAIYPLHGEEPEMLFANADAAMYEVKRNGRRGYRLYGDVAPVSDAVQAAVHLGHTTIAVPKTKPFRRSIQDYLSKDLIIAPKALVSVGAAALSFVLIFTWLFVSGTVGFQTAAPEELMTDSEMNDFGTASGSDNDAITLDSLDAETN